MSYICGMNNNIPYIMGYVKNKYLFSDTKVEGLTSCYIFGVKCLINRALLFHCQLENGAVFWSLPISAFCSRDNFEEVGNSEEKIINELQWWNCQSSKCDVTVFSYLEGYTADLKSRTGRIYKGKYLFTIDDYYGEDLPLGYAQDSDSKCFHIFQLENGNYAAYPNDKLLWYNENFVDRTLPIPHYKAYDWDLRTENAPIA